MIMKKLWDKYSYVILLMATTLIFGIICIYNFSETDPNMADSGREIHYVAEVNQNDK